MVKEGAVRKSYGLCDVGGAKSWPAEPGRRRRLRTVWLLIAGMTVVTLALVLTAYRPRLAQFARAVYPGDAPQDGEGGGTPSDVPRDKYLGGLLAAGFDEGSCHSRYQSTMYRKPSPHKPSPYLIHRLRKYEQLHRRCAPHTGPYNRTLQHFHDLSAPEETECKYIVWTPLYGLGNRILGLVSSFLYAVLTDRVLLIDGAKDMSDLFCEPFPATTWLLPRDFPISDYSVFSMSHALSYGNLLKSNKISNTAAGAGRPPPPFVYLHIIDDYQTEDMYFFCEPDQLVLRRVPWLLIKSDNYFVPGLFLNQAFEPELTWMFPEKETVFHHLSRYLLHPTNDVWGIVTRYYRAYLAPAKERLGLQIRNISKKKSAFEVFYKQVINCTQKEKLLPEVSLNGSSSTAAAAMANPRKTKAVLLTSLDPRYMEKITAMYGENPAAGGEVISVHQPSQEGKQQTDNVSHDKKAWAEMNLLSLTDELVTSAWSTFGYVGQGLGGIKPWVLTMPWDGLLPEPTCVRDISMEPCFHTPPTYICREKKNGYSGDVVPFVTRCVDVWRGVKLVDRT